MDEDEQEDFWDNVEKMDKVWGYVVDIVGVLLKNMPDEIGPELLSKAWPHYLKMLDPTRKDYEMINGTCFLVDALERGSDQMIQNLIQTVVPQKFFEILQTKGDNPLLCQNCVFGLGEYARRSTQEGFPHYTNCLQSVEFVLSRKFEGQEGPFNCYDNAVSTLGKLIYF